MADPTSMRDKAIALAKQGFRVFPLKPNSKKPAVKRFYEVASSDPEVVARKWTAPDGSSTDHNIGIATDDLLVIDVDNKNGKQGNTNFAALVYTHHLPYPTIEAVTPTGGRHLFYKLPQGAKVKNTTGKLAPDIDTRGQHGFVVGPGSIVPQGEYRWGRLPTDALWCVAPRTIVEAIQAPPAPEAIPVDGLEFDRPAAIDRAIQWLEETAPEAEEGSGGDATTFQIACRVKDFGISEETCLELMAEHWNDQKAHPPWSPDELELKIANAYVYGQNPIGVASPEAQFKPVKIEEVTSETGAAALSTDAEISPKTEKPPEKSGRRLFGWSIEEARSRSLKAGTAALVKKYLGQNEMSVLYGDSNTGKTFVALDLDFHIAAGMDWCGRKVAPGPVVYVAAEAGPSIAARVEALARRYKVNGSPPPLLVVPCLVDLFDPKAKDLKELVELINNWAKEHGQLVRKVTLDTLARVIGVGDENSARDVGILVQNMDKIRVATRAHVMTVHHSGKNASRGARGSSALRAATDTELEIENGVIRMRKQRNWEPAKDVRFRLSQVEIGQDEDGDKVTSCVVETGAAVDFEPQLTPDEQKAVEALRTHSEISQFMTGLKDPFPATAEVVWNRIYTQPEGEMGSIPRYESHSLAGRELQGILQSLVEKGYVAKVGQRQWVILEKKGD